MHRAGDAGLELPERVRAVLVHAVGQNHPLAVLLDALGDRLLVHRLDAGLAVLAGQLHVAREDEQWDARVVRRRDAGDHVGEARTLGPRARHHLASGPGVAVRRRGHGPLGPSAVARNARLRQWRG